MPAASRPLSRRLVRALQARGLARPGRPFGWFTDALGAGSFRGFWQHWNPLYGAVLQTLVYQPLRPRVGRAAAGLLTFAVSGWLLHDLPVNLIVHGAAPSRWWPPIVTVSFVLCALLAQAGDRAGLRYAAWPAPARVLANLAQVAACGAAGSAICRLF
ncbi:hypothetical protein [Rubrivivax gelatinosus]|uniref:Acyltransferase n=1 Tax=Rubrivivax gelatinosus TaxID=28068 RepID=A0A4R2M934_RUBGE|nr:hypothetical protein [Rubrivivax gelatinosus]MBK1688784.1 hypothetical protein [Rubrivivax gelatinosus]TCP02890.1 hypothetical protein EV684_10556 [Rubrivivax gelatinosus]